MKTSPRFRIPLKRPDSGWIFILLGFFLLPSSFCLPASAQGTTFTYQGSLATGGASAAGSYDLRFILYDAEAGGSQVGPILTNSATAVSNGLFMVSLDFGSVFNGAGRWLEVGVRSNNMGSFTTLSPRQAVTPTPYAMLAGTVTNGAITASQLAPGAVTATQLASGSVGSAALADSIALGDASTLGQLDVYRTAAGTPGISLFGNASQISTFGSDGLEQIRLYGGSWGEILLFDSQPANAVAADLSANSSAGGYLSLRNTNGSARAYLSGANGGGLLQLYSGTNTENIRLNSMGNSWLRGGALGMGTINPSAALHIVSPSNTPPAGLSSADNGLLLGSEGATGYKWIQSYGGALALNPVGNSIGVGTTNPVDCLLDIEGATHINDNDIYLRPASDRLHGLGYRTNFDGPFIYGFNGGALGVSAPETFALRWTYTGDIVISNNLTIGSSAVVSKLTVDNYNTNAGVLVPGLNFGGGGSGEGISSKRTAGTGQYGLDFYTASQKRVSIMNSGLVGINTTNPAFNLEVNGTAGKPGGGSWSVSSDARLKKNVQPLRGVLEKLLELRGVSYEYKDPEKIHELSGERIGMVAQEVEKVFPDWVETGPDGYERLTFRGFEALTVEALRELRDEKEAKLEQLQRENRELKQRLERVERFVSEQTGNSP